MERLLLKILSRRESAALLIGLLTFSVALLPLPLFELSLLFFTYLLGYELENILGRNFIRWFPPLVFLFSLFSPFAGLLIAALTALGYGYIQVRLKGYYSFETFNAFTSVFLVSVYGGFFPLAAVYIKEHSQGLLIATILAVWAADSLAYYGGKKFGKNPFFKEISPNKTREGFLFGLLGGVLVGTIASSVLKVSFNPLGWFVVITASVFGDLFESFIKRSFGVKDSSNLLGSHGGFLDRFDALLFALLAVASFF